VKKSRDAKYMSDTQEPGGHPSILLRGWLVPHKRDNVSEKMELNWEPYRESYALTCWEALGTVSESRSISSCVNSTWSSIGPSGICLSDGEKLLPKER
jgi:hypothetical protein